MNINRFILIILCSTGLIGCQADEIMIDPIPDTEEKIYTLDLIYENEFSIGHETGLNYFNDITVGVLSNNSDQIRLITASGTSTHLLEGTSLQDIDESTEIVSPEPGTFYANYIGLGQLIQTPSGKIYSVFHAEEHDGTILPGNIPGFYASVGLASSNDGGNNFSINSAPLIANTFDITFDNGYSDGGLGEPSMLYSKDSSEVFVYYVDHNRNGRGVNICMAKFLVDATGEPDFSSCYYLDATGNFSNTIIRSKEVVAGVGYSDAIFPHVTYNAVMDEYIMVYSLNHYGEFHNGNSTPVESGIYYRTSKDGIRWESAPSQLLSDWSIPYSFANHSFSWHPNLIYSQEDQTSGYLLYSKADNLQQGHKMWAIPFEIMEE